jgi:dihydrofolate reductase
MSTVTAELAVSLDGFVADADDGMLTRRLEEQHAVQHPDVVGAVICGRRSFDITGGWGGEHPLGAPVFVVTHSVPYGWPREDAAMTFVTDGIESALEQASAVAGDATVAVASPSLAQQYLNSGLLDRIRVTVVPVLLGEGIRFFRGLTAAPVELERVDVIEDSGATHLSYRICRSRV